VNDPGQLNYQVILTAKAIEKQAVVTPFPIRDEQLRGSAHLPSL